jgi:translocator protein
MGTQKESMQTPRPHSIWALIGWLLLCFAVAGVASLYSVQNSPPPYNWVLPLVWAALYALMAVAAWMVWKTRPSPCRRTGLLLFLVQLWFGVLWSWIFYSRHQLGVAFVDLLVLWIAIFLTILNFRKVSTTAPWLLVPYLVWVAFMGYLNLVFWRWK